MTAGAGTAGIVTAGVGTADTAGFASVTLIFAITDDTSELVDTVVAGAGTAQTSSGSFSGSSSGTGAAGIGTADTAGLVVVEPTNQSDFVLAGSGG